MFRRRLKFETLETRDLLAGQPFFALELSDLAVDAHCTSTTAVDICGSEAEREDRIQHLWNTTIPAYLADDLWLDNYQYDAGHNLMVPLHAAFQLANEDWQLQFADHFRRFAAAEASTGYQGEVTLGRIQYLYLGSRFVSLAHQTGKPELVPPELIASIYNSLESVWQREPAWQWERESFPGGIRERLKWKLETSDVSSTFHRAIIDFEEFVFAIAADLRSYERTTRGPDAYSPMITEILAMALRVHDEQIVRTENGGWLMQPGAWTDHSTYAHAGHTQISDEMPEFKVPGIAEDTAHAVRRPLWLRSLAEAYDAESAQAQFYKSLIVGLETQFFDTILVQPTDAFSTHRLTNFMDGRNGVYRWNYATHPGDGYAPFELSGVLHDGWWGFLNTERVRQTFREIVAEMPFTEQQLPTFLGPGTSRTRHPMVANAYAYRNGFLELTSRLASEMSGWKPTFRDLPNQLSAPSAEVAEFSLGIHDFDGDQLTTSVRAESMEYLLRAQLGLSFTGHLHENWGGIGEKWLRGFGGVWYFVKANGELWEWNGGAHAEGWFVAQLPPVVHAAPDLLYNAQPNRAHAEVTVVDGTLQVSPRQGFTGSVPVIVTASDGRHASSRIVFVQFEHAPNVPRLIPIGEQVITSAETELTVELETAGGRTEKTEFSARAISIEYVLDNQLGLTHDGDYEENWGGRREKWLEGRFNTHYFLTPDGSLYRWDRSPTANGHFIVSLGSEIYANPARLYDAPESLASVDTLLTDNVLSIAPSADFVGTFAVEVSVGDKDGDDRQIFAVTVENRTDLEQEDIVDVFAMPSSQDRAFLHVRNRDRGRDSVVYSARAESFEYALDQQFGFETNGNLYENWGGLDEKWIISGERQWYFITPEGSLYRWDGRSSATGDLVAILDPEVHKSPELIYEAERNAAPALVSAWGNLLEVDPQTGFSGTFSIEVTTDHPRGVDRHWIRVDVNQTPDLAPIPDQEFSAGASDVNIDLDVDDPDDDLHIFNVHVRTYEAFLDDSLGLRSTGNYHLNWGGTNEKWLIAGDNSWYFIRPDGALYLWDRQDSATGQQIAQLAREFYASPQLLHDATHDTPFQPTVVGNRLVLNPGQLAARTYVIDIEVSDGLSSDQEQFRLIVAG